MPTVCASAGSDATSRGAATASAIAPHQVNNFLPDTASDISTSLSSRRSDLAQARSRQRAPPPTDFRTRMRVRLRLDLERAEIWGDASSFVAGIKMLIGIDPKQDYKDKVAEVSLRSS